MANGIIRYVHKFISISFEDTGRLLISPVTHKDSLHRMGIDVASTIHVGDFSSGQKQYLDYHREREFFGIEGDPDPSRSRMMY